MDSESMCGRDTLTQERIRIDFVLGNADFGVEAEVSGLALMEPLSVMSLESCTRQAIYVLSDFECSQTVCQH